MTNAEAQWFQTGYLHLVADTVDVYQKVSRAAEDLAGSVWRWIDYEPRILNPAKEDIERNVHFESRKRTAEAGMDASAPAQVLVVSTFWIEFVRIEKPLWITVPCTINKQDRGAFRDCRPSDLYVGESGSAWKELDRRLKAQYLLYSPRNQFRSAAQQVN